MYDIFYVDVQTHQEAEVGASQVGLAVKTTAHPPRPSFKGHLDLRPVRPYFPCITSEMVEHKTNTVKLYDHTVEKRDIFWVLE